MTSFRLMCLLGIALKWKNRSKKVQMSAKTYVFMNKYLQYVRVGVVWTFLLSSMLSLLFSPSLWETARYRLKYCLKGPLNPKQSTNQPMNKYWKLSLTYPCYAIFATLQVDDRYQRLKWLKWACLPVFSSVTRLLWKWDSDEKDKNKL